MKDQIEMLRAIVVNWRSSYIDKFPWPSDNDSLLFAITEIGEAIDALLRNNPEYKRNVKKGHDVYSELGDALFMILSIKKLNVLEISPVSVDDIEISNSFTYSLVAIMSSLSSAYMYMNRDEDKMNAMLNIAISLIVGLRGFELMSVATTMDKLYNNHIKSKLDKMEVM